MLLEACLMIYDSENWVFLQNGFCEISNKKIHIFHENRDDVILDNANYIKPDIIIYASWVGGSIELLRKLKEYNHKIISDFQDCADGLDFLGENSSRIYQMTETLKISDGLLIRDPRWLESKLCSVILKKKKYILYPDYLFKKAENLPFADPQKDKSVIFLGSLGLGRLEDEIGWYKTIQAFLRQDFMVTAIPSPGHIDRDIRSKYWRLACRNPQFHLIESLSLEKLSLKVQSCGFGININQKTIFPCKTNFVNLKYLHNCSSSRMCDYAEEGLGTIISPDLKFIKKTWDASGACITCDANNIEKLDKIIARKRTEFSDLQYRTWENDNLLNNNLLKLKYFIGDIKIKKTLPKKNKSSSHSTLKIIEQRLYYFQSRLANLEKTLCNNNKNTCPYNKRINLFFTKKTSSIYKRLFLKYYKKQK